MKVLRLSLPLIGLLMLALLVPSCRDDKNTVAPKLVKDYSSDVQLQWNQLFVDIDRYTPGYRPPAAARLLGYTGLAVYESVVAGMPDYNSLELQYQGLSLPNIDQNKEYHWPTVVNAVYGEMFRSFYPDVDASYLFQINSLETSFNDKYSKDVSADVFQRSKEYGVAVAKAVFDWSKTDTWGHEAYKNPLPADYTPPTTGTNGEKLWQPSYPDYTRALFPYWGKVRAFAVRPEDKIAKVPATWSEDPNSQFYNQAKEIQLSVDNSTYESRWIAEFWSDDIFKLTFEPAGRWVAVANQLVEEDNVNLETSAELYAKMGMSLCDVGICIWNSKYLYNVERPVSYIRRNMEANWISLLNDPVGNKQGVTPPFPAYPSGHSGFGGAAAIVLSDIFGPNRGMTDRCHEGRTEFNGTPRTFLSFTDMAVENAYSRLPLGVHFRMDCDEGIRLGYLAGHRVVDLPWRK